MNQIIGIAMMCYALALVAHYRPTSRNSKRLCTICFVMGLVALIAGGGGWAFQIGQLVLIVLVAACAWAELHREKKFFRRRRALLKTCRRASYAALSGGHTAGAGEILKSA